MLKKMLAAMAMLTVIAGCTMPAEEPATDNGGEVTTDTTERAEEPPNMTTSQENALKSAQGYIDMMAFSEKGLIKQLTSAYGDDYPKADAVFAVKHVDVNWKAEAVEAAQGYLDTMPMSRKDLLQQLTSNYGDRFTKAQAEYAVEQVY